MHSRREWAEDMPADDAPADDMPVPLHLLQAQAARAQRDRMLLLLVAFFAAALALSML